MKFAFAALALAASASALTPPKSSVAAATRGGAMEATALKAAAPIKQVSAMPRGGVIANFVGVDVALLSYFFFWYLGNYYCPRPRPNLRGDGAATARRRRDVKNSVAQWIAYQTSNLGVAGSSPVGIARGCSSVAERPLCMRKVQGSNPCSSTNTQTPWRNG